MVKLFIEGFGVIYAVVQQKQQDANHATALLTS
jgi:hypothetical protein